MSKFGVQDRRDLPVFIHSELDDFGLDPFEFRVYARLVRRAGSGGTAYESVPNVARATRMSERKVRYALKVLCAVGLIGLAEARQGETTVYAILDKTDWCSRSDVTQLRDAALAADPEKAPQHRTPAPDAAPPTPALSATPPAPHAGVPLHHMQPTPAPDAAKGTPLKVLPIEGSPLKVSGQKNGRASRAQELFDLYNAEKPSAWSKATELNADREKKLERFATEHGARAFEIFRAALAFASSDDWWSIRKFGLDTFFEKNRMVIWAEKAANVAALMPEADRRILTTAQQMYAALGGDDAE